MGILGLGVDLVSIPRIKTLIDKYGERFLFRFFCEEEVNYAFKKSRPEVHIAASFASKEAFYKAVGGYSPFILKEICLKRKSNGAPFLLLQGNANQILSKINVSKVWVALSHEKDYTISIVVLTK
ncbi:MAG: holo-[acyl-carrier-protein] synthase [Thermodesulfobacteria bacterium]|nr:holo-[acyl-carrier-protein] synthase [Thermodesulfobacteriota bacterium]